MADREACSVCKKRVNAKAAHIKCGYCDSSYHKKCSNLNDSTFEILTSNEDLEWFCLHCNPKTCKPTDNVSQNMAIISELKSIVHELKREVELLKQQPKLQSSAFDESEVLESVICEMNDRNNRSKNIILYGLCDSNGSTTNPSSCDKNLVLDIIKEMPNTVEAPVSVTRIGRPQNPDKRPLKIVFASEQNAKAFLSGFLTIKKTTPLVKDLSISKDRTLKEREYYKKLKKELQERSENGESDLIIKSNGGKGNPFAVLTDACSQGAIGSPGYVGAKPLSSKEEVVPKECPLSLNLATYLPKLPDLGSISQRLAGALPPALRRNRRSENASGCSTTSSTTGTTGTTPAKARSSNMPGLRGRRGWCSCFQNDEPPEITYCVVDQTGTLSLQALTPTQPMPEDEEELNAKFAELVEELDLTAPNKAAMLSLPSEKKWQIYCSRKKDQEGETDLSHLPEHYIERANALAKLPFPMGEGEEVDSELRTRARILDSLKTALRTQPHSFVLRFVELDGLPSLLGFLASMDHATAHSPVHTALIGCVKALMNNSTGRAHVLAHPTGINTIAQSLATDSIKIKVAALEILGAVCLVPGGHRKVLEAMIHYQRFANERTRFQGIVNDLDRSTGIYRDEVGLKTAIMSLVNAVLNYGPGQESLEFRLHLRYEFLMLGIQPIIDKLRTHENETLNRHLDFFEMVRNEDEKELARKFEKEHVDTKSATAMFELLRKKLSHTSAYPHLLSLLQHMLLLPLDYGSCPQHFLLFDRIIQQIILQTESGDDPDVSALKINVKKLVHLLAKEEELVIARTRADELEKENTELVTKLAKKEQELDLRSQEKEDIETSLARVKERLEKETKSHLEAKQKLSELSDKVSELSEQAAWEHAECQRLQQLLSSGSIPDDAKAEGYVSTSGPNPPPPPFPTSGMPPPPPPLPSFGKSMSSMPPPPPPPPTNGIAPSAVPAPPAPTPPRLDIKKKNVPIPTNPLKSFNWSKLPDVKVTGTIWTELDETKLYNVMDLENIDKLFCAYQKNGVVNDGSVEDLRQIGKNRTKILSVIDGRRAQNCTILLSKLKMTDEEICKAILSMDCKDQLPIDMVEQILKFTPSAEESALLEEHSDEIDSLARADRFLYEISKIPHHEQRLRCLHYKKRFAFWVGEVEPRIRAVMEGAREVTRSRRLRRLLEIVLALGNYMNRGARGNACGFRLASLNRLVDTKSSAAKGTTLLHYLVEVLETKFKDILKLDEDLPHVKQAAKVSLAELEKDMAQLRSGLKEVEREIEFHRSQVVTTGDRFLPVMKEFLSSATCRFSELEDLFQDMKTRFDRAVKLFGEDQTSVQPDDFFGIFDGFLVAFNEARHDNDSLKKKREEEEKRAKQDAELKKRTMERKHSRGEVLPPGTKSNGIVNSALGLKNGLPNGNTPNSNGDAKGEFDDLISALRTGDVFGEDMAKFKRSRRRVSGSGNSPPRSSGHHHLSREDTRERVLNNGRERVAPH